MKKEIVYKNPDYIYGSLKQEKRSAKNVAKQLGYDNLLPNVYERIDSCLNVFQVREILATCRHMM